MSYFGDDDPPFAFLGQDMFDESCDKNKDATLPKKESFVELPEVWNPGGGQPNLPRAFFGDSNADH